jgi:hypothetical protein
MIKFLALIRANGTAKVLNVASSEIHHVVATEKATGSKIIGEYSDPRDARRAMLMGLQGYRPRFNPQSDPRFKPRQAS